MRKLLLVGLLSLAAVPLVYGVAYATPVVGAPTITTLLRATLAEGVDVDEDGIEFETAHREDE